ncbi:MAG: FAD-dependent oxidoreductase [Gammaproteobacteria bacterium]|nr:FAD-dependent oxidoreductase [Gammaproteobacteria bacterium]MYG96389.1 FAD-dependent oxidoreductase [Gammaproteobacteria bacterium]
MESQARIVIVGGGIMGVGLAYHLAEEGAKDILLIEKGELTSGSTWHAAGQCPNLVGNYNLAKIHECSIALYSQLERLTGQAVGWHGCGSIRFALTERDLDWFRYLRGIADNVGYHMEIIDVEQIRKLNPFINTNGVLAGAWTANDGHADPSGLTQAMARGARENGARIVRNNRVTEINSLPGGEWEVVTGNGTVIAETVVNAAGCFARQVAQMVGADLPISNIQHHYLVSGDVPELIEREVEIPVTRDPWASSYIRQEQKSGLIGIYEQAGITEAWQPEGLPPWQSDSELFSDDLDRLMPWLGRAMERMPIFEPAGIKRIVNGAISHSPDGLPLLGPVAGLRNFWLCCGSSFGIAQGAGCGKYLAQWILHGDSEINMTGFDPRRFGVFADADYMRARGRQDYGMTYATVPPGEELPAARKLRKSPLYDKLRAGGCVFTETFGWERPKWFSTDGRDEEYSFRHNNVFELVREECMAVRERVGILDLSGFAKYDVTGPDAERLLDRLCANRLPKPGRIALTHLLSENGRIGGEATVTRLGDESFYVLSAAGAELRDLDHLQQGVCPGEQVRIDNVTDRRGVLVLAGPHARDVLARVSAAHLDNQAFPWLSGMEIEIAGVPVRALRVNYVGELGWELHPLMEHMETLHDALLEAGAEYGIRNFGLYAVNSLRLEKAYRGWGAELTNEVTLIDADMERFIKFDKGDFTGREATLNQGDRELQLIYFSLDSGDADVQGGEPIFTGESCVGVTTSGGYGHYVRQSLGFGYVPPALAEPGAALTVEVLGRRRQISLLAEPVHDPANERLRA